MRLRIITDHTGPFGTRVVLSNSAGVEVNLIAHDTADRDQTALLDCELPELTAISITGEISHVSSYDAADRAALAPLKAKARELRAEHDARTRAAATRAAADLITTSDAGGDEAVQYAASLLRAHADEIAPAAAPTEEPPATPEVTSVIVGPTRRVLDEVYAERAAQDAKWGEQNHRDGTGWDTTLMDGWSAGQLADAARNSCQRNAEMGIVTWLDILGEEVAEALAESDPARLRAELIQVAAVAAAWVEAIDRRTAGA